MKNLRVLHISSSMTWRGGEQQIAYLVDGLRKKGVQQWVFCADKSKMKAHCIQKKIAYHSYTRKSALNISAARKIKQLSQLESIDIIHLHDAHAHTAAWLSASIFGNKTPIVLSRRVDFPIKKNFFSKKKYNHSSIKKILCVSGAIKDITAPDIEVSSKLEVVYSGIDLERFGYENTHILRKEFKLPADKYLIGCVAAIAPQKDYFTFVDTVDILIQKNLQAHFFIIGGDGGEQEQIEAYIASKNLQKHITLTGFRTDIPQILPELDVFLFTSKTEGLGTSLLDAFAAKIAVVATAAGGIPEIVRQEQSGLLSPIGDAPKLAEYVTRILQEPSLKTNLIQGASQLLQEFTKEKTMEKTLKIYEEIID